MSELYLSQLFLNLQDSHVRRDLGNPYELHRTIMRAFAGRREAAGVLHRLEHHPRHDRPVLLVQSTEEPDWHFLQDTAYLAGNGRPGEAAVKPFSLALHAGQILRFRLRANPTVKKKREGKHSNRVPLVRPEQQQAWLERQAARHGFTLLRLDSQDDRAERGTVRLATEPQTLTLFSVRFDGLLRVDDPERLLAAVRGGIGPARAFGCGLLSLAPT